MSREIVLDFRPAGVSKGQEVITKVSPTKAVDQLEGITDTDKRNKLAEQIISLHNLTQIDRDFALEGFRGKYISFKHIVERAKLRKTVFRPKVVAHEHFGHATVISSKGGTIIEESYTGKGNAEGYVIAMANRTKAIDEQQEDIGAFAMGGMAIENFLGDHENHGCGHDLGVAHRIVAYNPRTSIGRLYADAYNAVKGNRTQIIQGSWERARPYLNAA